jgi:hypothetical protein
VQSALWSFPCAQEHVPKWLACNFMPYPPPILLSLLACSRQFSKPPIGPVGAHLTLTDTKWAVAGEVVLESTLEVWIVDNARDNNVSNVVWCGGLHASYCLQCV